MEINADSFYLKVKDHSVTGEYFDLYYNNRLDMLITMPKPELMDRYYESDSYISHTDSNSSLFDKCYQLVKGITLRGKVNLINANSSGGRNLLDIGAGTGEFLSIAKNNNWNVLGTEPNEKARNAAGQKGIDLLKDTSTYASNSFDVITMWHVLEHVGDLTLQIAELKRLLKTDGTVLIAVPNFKSFDAKYYGQYWAAYDVPRHLSHFSKTSIERIFAAENMAVKDILPMKFDAFYVSLLSEKYKGGKMNILNAIYIGLKSNFKARRTVNYSSHIYVLKNIE